jgi:hypothetical protein
MFDNHRFFFRLIDDFCKQALFYGGFFRSPGSVQVLHHQQKLARIGMTGVPDHIAAVENSETVTLIETKSTLVLLEHFDRDPGCMRP